ncbi:MAG: CPBP family intramembrane metalloprotease [Clostridiales bacterium]|nr:CPBP family intramembrane metalloprotease [Clostridiales bacterium]
MLENKLKNYKPYDFSASCSFYLGAIIVTLIMQGVAGIVSAALAGSVPDIADNGDFNTAFMILFQVANAGFIVLYSYVKKNKFSFTFVRDGESGKGLNAMCFIVPIIGAAVLMAAMYLPTMWYGYLTEAIGFPSDKGNISLTTPSSIVMIVTASVFLAPIFEETIYRGVLFRGLRENGSTLKAVMLSALAFMLMHMSPLQVVFQFALGVASAYLALKSGRLLPSVIMHAAANALALVMQMTAFGDVLWGWQVWLTEHIAAAVFITLGLFVAGFAAIYFLVPLAFGKGLPFGKRNAEITEAPDISGDGASQKTVAADINAVRDETMAELRKKEGRIRYFIALGISLAMFIINLVAGILS